MKITNKILSIPPYLSTSWEQISSLLYDEKTNTLTVILKDNSTISVSNFSKEDAQKAFECHSQFLESPSKNMEKSPFSPIGFGIPFNENGKTIEGLGAAMEHNPDQKDAPDLPDELLTKISSVAKALGLDKIENLPHAEPHCNCFHCQMARAMHKKSHFEEENEVEAVSDEELKFRTWDIKQKTDKLYIVSNPLDEKEKYNVFIGHPIGCTCGHNNCEHIKAVLRS